MLGELVQTTAGNWITTHQHGARTDTVSSPAKCSSVTKPASVMAAGTPHGPAAPAMRRYTGAAHRGTNCTNVEASQNYGICCAQRPDQAPAWLASRSAREETSMKKLAIRREHRINETQAESAIKDYVDHVADIAKFPDGTGGYPRLRHTPWRHPARQHRPRDRCRAGIQPTCRITTDSRAAGDAHPARQGRRLNLLTQR